MIDDFRSFSWNLDYLLRLLDRYPMQVRVLDGGYVWFKAKYIFITSNIDPREWFHGDLAESAYPKLRRRFKDVIHFGGESPW